MSGDVDKLVARSSAPPQWGALAVLDEIAHVDGMIGVVARFAKARFLLR